MRKRLAKQGLALALSEKAKEFIGNQGYDRGAANPWGAHDPAVRLSLDLRPRPSYCISMKSIRSAVSKKKKRFIDGDFDLDLDWQLSAGFARAVMSSAAVLRVTA